MPLVGHTLFPAFYSAANTTVGMALVVYYDALQMLSACGR